MLERCAGMKLEEPLLPKARKNARSKIFDVLEGKARTCFSEPKKDCFSLGKPRFFSGTSCEIQLFSMVFICFICFHSSP